ncbi:MAG TPA: signal peptide peptidase SppA [Candidatus Ozemobacteraceae bacterium]|nr:signal peptide peptidase SppA [Candidatus Ozemobacteraceae bacterium]
MKRVCSVALAILLFAGAASAQGLFDLFGSMSGAEGEKKVRVSYVEGDRASTDEVLLITVKGIIRDSDEEEKMPFEIRQNMIEKLKKDVEAALEREQIKAVLLEIDSPGGEVTAADVIHHHLSKIKGANKPVVALIGMMGASGGYYIACAADQIWAHPTSIVGSIGVIMQGANLEKFAQLVGYRHVPIKSDRTPKKDLLSPFREMTEEERTMLLSIVDTLYDRFLEIVCTSRKKNREEIAKLADGSIFTASQALKNGLLDGIGYREEALAKALELANLKSGKLVKRKTKKGLSEILSELADAGSGMPGLWMRFQSMIDAGSTPSLEYRMQLQGAR